MNRQPEDVSSRVSKVMRAAKDAALTLPEAQRSHFRRFCRAVARQLRSPYVARHGVKNIPRELLALFATFQACPEGMIQVTLEAGDDGITLLRSNMRDQSFIVDTVRLLLDQVGASLLGGFNAVVLVQRDAEGSVLSLDGDEGHRESVVQFEIGNLPPDTHEDFARRLDDNLRLAHAMVADFGRMTGSVDGIAALFGRTATRDMARGEAYREGAEFLRWLLADNFVFMGMVDGDIRLGIERDGLDAWTPVERQRRVDFNGVPVNVRKGAAESTVHRAGRVDEIRIEVPDEAGRPDRIVLLLGMFTFRAVTQDSRSVPILRGVLARILREDNSLPGSWRYKGVANVFDSLPTEYLFTADHDETRLMIDRVLDAEAERDVRVLLVQKSDTNVTFVLGAMPRAQYDDGLRRRMEGLLISSTGATYLDHGVLVGRFETVLVHFYLTGARELALEEQDNIRERLRDMATPWDQRVFDALIATHGEEEGDRLFASYGGAFEDRYVRHATALRVVRDVEHLELLEDVRPVAATLFEDRKGRLSLRLYQRTDIILSKSLPVLTNFGLVVSDQYADTAHPLGAGEVVMDTFRLKGAWGLLPADIIERGGLLTEAVEAIFTGSAEDDELNRLVLRAALPWRDVDLLRAYRGHLFQLGLSRARVTAVFSRHPAICAALVRYFRARFDPNLSDAARKKAVSKAVNAVDDGLRKVYDGAHDYVLRCTYDLMRGTVRTNFFRPDRKRWYISFKVDHELVDFMPEVGLKYEIYVHHPEMEGIHFRGGKVARGGLRWSDRIDYRTEILGLVTTQMVKNVLIVPEGAKGGFRLKEIIEDRGLRRRRADDLYKWFIRALLDLTDNLVAGEVVNPPGVVMYDGADDPYLVVAADKGTAHLSDTANGVAVDEYGHWLGDAFASGGSHGYDHKKVGITARGAWECVKRHFAELGLDPSTDEFTAIGIGDTGGDVFGNGVVEFPKMRLVAAFNHLHVFLDPEPDTETAFRERRRLFRAARGWGDYDQTKLGPGGGIFGRRAKSILLSPQAKQMLGALKDELSPDAVIRLILRMNVDLLWSGGIGTYVKASAETHQDAGDPANDSVRVNADELRCRVVGEGANLSFTARARFEFDLAGGRLNTDFVDNSGGVDMSDHEVNLKILLGSPLAAGDIDEGERNRLIAELTKSVAKDVLANNDTQARQLSIDAIRSHRDPFRFARAIRWIEEMGSPDADDLSLPDNTELRRRQTQRRGLTRPDLAVLSSHVKMHVYRQLKVADPAAIVCFDRLLSGYFPKRIREMYPEAIRSHMLAREIGMTVALTQAVADCGATFFPVLLDLTGRHPVEILGAYFQVRESFNIDQLRRQINAAGSDLGGRYRAWIRVSGGILGLCATWLAPGRGIPDADGIDRIRAILARLPRLRGRDEQARVGGLAKVLVQRGLPKAVAERCVNATDLTLASEIAAMQVETGDSERDAIVRYQAIGQASGLLSAIRAIEDRSASGRWDSVAIGILRTRYLALLTDLVRKTELGNELRLSSDRLSHKLSWGPLQEVSGVMSSILKDEPDVGAYLVAEERLRGLLTT
ncbi:MAG TPA: NAD-glutamate dehydrogenase [Myxococcota bacterium]|nr:NAD-glutamate dehydrogenase [Myxococcota bacterium]